MNNSVDDLQRTVSVANQRNDHTGLNQSGWVACLHLSLMALGLLSGCHSILNGWLDPSVLGNFRDTSTQEIRSSLTLEDAPSGIPGAVFPSPEDSLIEPVEYPISPGDTLNVEIYELRQRLVPYQAQVSVSAKGDVNFPVVGRINAAGLTIPEFEAAIVQALRDRNVLVDPDVTVNPLFLQNATYSIFGIGVSAANNAPLRAGTFPIRRPDLRILEAINDVGGLNESVIDVYVFRYDQPAWLKAREKQSEQSKVKPESQSAGEALPDQPDAQTYEAHQPEVVVPVSAEEALIEAVVEEQAPSEKNQAARTAGGPAKTLEPEPSQPYLWVNNEFVPDPKYKPPPGDRSAPMPRFETATPAVNWDRIAEETTYRIIRIPAEKLRVGDPDVNIVIHGGDVIRIVSGEIGVYYVMGQVNRVGPFAFNTEQITLKAAVAAAGGLTGLAWPNRCTVYRRIGQREQMIQVDLDRIFAGKQADFLIKRGDIINVGTHPLAPFVQTLRGLTVPNPVFNIGYSFTYARNFADIDTFAARRNPRNDTNQFPNLFP